MIELQNQALFDEIISGNYRTENKIVIAGTTYGSDKIYNMSYQGDLFADGTLSVGNCVSCSFTAEIDANSNTIPKMAEVRPYTRVMNSEKTSEWIPQGVFYIDERRDDKLFGGNLTITCYDAMMKLEQDYCTSAISNWYKNDLTVVNEICSRVGLTCDNASLINKNYSVAYPGYGDGAKTMREVLGYIGACYLGSWTITATGKLRLITLNGLPESTNYLIGNGSSYLTFGTGSNETRILLGL